jgi:pimeloyl-ACP methyl ester carboxylesterase
MKALVIAYLLLLAALGSAAGAQSSSALQGFVAVNGVRLQYLDWGGSGPTLILIPGLGDNPYVFDDLAPAFSSHLRVIAYARRGSGDSDTQGPYDRKTLTEDLRGLMDALGIKKAILAGYSAGGDEVTQMAADYPDRVDKIIYFDGGYDETDPDVKALLGALPVDFFKPPASATRSFDAYRLYNRNTFFTDLDDMNRIEANLRDKVIISQDGTVTNRTPDQVVGALFAALVSNERRDYRKIQCPALAIFSDHHYNVHLPDPDRRAAILAYEKRYWKPFQAKSIERVKNELRNVQIARVPGAHTSFILTERQQVVDLVQNFIDTSNAGVQSASVTTGAKR